jgi:hypothetical protein
MGKKRDSVLIGARKGIIEVLSIFVITVFVIFIFFAWLPFIPAILAEYTPEPIKSILEWIADFGSRISHFLP